MDKILIIEDDVEINTLLTDFLKENGYVVYSQYDGLHVLDFLHKEKIDLIILDIMLPYRSGDIILADIRRQFTIPVLIISAKETTQNKIDLLRLGADDYIMKPFDSKEMVARVKAVLRRSTKATVGESTPTPTPQVPQQELEIVTFPDLQINLSDYSVHYKDQMIEMPPKELELFYFLASHPNQVFTREQLLDHIWSYDYIGDTRTVDVHIKRLREKFKDHDQWKLATVWGIGYKFEFHEKGNA